MFLLLGCVYISVVLCITFFFNDTATTEIYTYLHTLSLHDALPISYVDRGEEYRVLVQAEREGRQTQADLERINVRSRTGMLVPLSAVVTLREVAEIGRAHV